MHAAHSRRTRFQWVPSVVHSPLWMSDPCNTGRPRRHVNQGRVVVIESSSSFMFPSRYRMVRRGGRYQRWHHGVGGASTNRLEARFLFLGREDLLPLLGGDFLLWGVDWCCYDVSLLFLLYISNMFAARSAFRVAKPLLRRGYAEGVATDKLRLSLVLPHEVSQDSLFTIPQGD